jgi:LysR family transcriptional regulator, regulator of abg operon
MPVQFPMVINGYHARVKLNALECFVAVVDAGSIHGGARKAGVSQPALTKALRNLEQELGVQLVVRTTRGSTPTQFGRALYRRARIVAGEVQRARQEIGQMRGRMAGELAFSVAPAAMLQLVPGAVRAFRAEHPAVRLRIFDGPLPSAIAQLRAGDIEFAVGSLTRHWPRREFRVERLVAYETAVVARRDHPLAGARSLAELQEADWANAGARGSIGIFTDETFARHGLTPPRPAIECGSFAALLAMLASQDLLAMLPKPFVDLPHLKGVLARVPVREQTAPTAIGLVQRADAPLTPAAQIFTARLREAAQGRASLAPGHRS